MRLVLCCFLDKEVLGVDLLFVDGVTRAKKSERVPVVFTPDEVLQVLGELQPPHALMVKLLYGAGLTGRNHH
ncbi:MAG TPA: hypothetical protein EYH06_13190 [Chromatiales bacterium]|nr:hypothetical protein [Thiotrichales bacterium]HIP69518.1 hypothetical protein [Chromatiales bacterium]